MTTSVAAARSSVPLRVTPPAKINLHLRVGPPTADGFHPLVTWMVTVGLFDILDFVPIEQPGIRLVCDDPAIPCDASNLIVRAASALLEWPVQSSPGGSDLPGVSAALQKRIPVGAGLGGGSSDGSFALLALNRLLRLYWPVERLSGIAAQFGSDLPFFLYGPSSICTGRGQIVVPIARPRVRFALLILPDIHMPTPAVYRRFDELMLGDASAMSVQPDWRHWAGLAASDLLALLQNDLEPAAFSVNPALAELHQRASGLLGRIVRMSGSGSSFFTLFDELEEADRAARLIEDRLRIRARAVELCPAVFPANT